MEESKEATTVAIENKEVIDNLNEFISNPENRKKAEEKAIQLWAIATCNEDMAKAETRVFTRTEVVRRSSLSHRTLDELLKVLETFGIAKIFGNTTFGLIFNLEQRIKVLETEILSLFEIVAQDAKKYEAMVDSMSDKTKEEREAIKDALMSQIEKMFA